MPRFPFPADPSHTVVGRAAVRTGRRFRSSVLAKQLMDKRDYDGAIPGVASRGRQGHAGRGPQDRSASLADDRRVALVRKQELVQAVEVFISSAKSAEVAGDNATGRRA